MQYHHGGHGRGCQQKGYQYVAITDHSESLSIANGLSVERLSQNIAESRRVSEKLAPFRVLIGAEWR